MFYLKCSLFSYLIKDSGSRILQNINKKLFIVFYLIVLLLSTNVVYAVDLANSSSPSSNSGLPGSALCNSGFGNLGLTNAPEVKSDLTNSASDSLNNLQNQNQKILNLINNKDNLQNQKTPDLSQIEKIFNNTQIGYDIFDRGAFLSSNSKISKDYRLKIGDRLDVFFWGDSIDLIAITGNNFLTSSNDLAIDKEGNLVIPGVGVIPAKGKKTFEVEQEVLKVLSSKFNKINVKITLADLGNFPIIVTGNVKYKGTVYVNNGSNIIDALSLSGGVLKTGTLRDIVYINGKTKTKLTIDLYDVLLNGNFKNIKFNEGDIIFVKPIGKVVDLEAGVKNSGIYEFKNNETLRHLINYAGGLLPSIDQKVVQVQSYDNTTGQRQIKDVPYTNLWYIQPKDGDIVAFKNLYNMSENLVYIQGNVKHPGSFQYKSNMKLSDILSNKDELLSQTFTDQAVIERVSSVDKKIIYIPVSLMDFFNKYINPELKPQDKIKIYPSTTAETIEVSGYIANPGLIPYQDGLTLKKLLNSIRFADSTNFEPVNNKDHYNSNEIKTKNIVVEITSKNNDTTAQENNQSNKQNNVIQDTAIDNNLPVNSSKQVSKTQIVYLYDLIVNNDLRYDIPINSGDKLVFRSLQPNESIENISVFGYVNSPGSFKYQDGMKLKDAIQLANGLEKNGNLKGLIFLRPSLAVAQQNNMADTLNKMQEDISLKVSSIQATNSFDSKSANTDIQSFLNNQKDLLDLVKAKAQQNYGRLMIEVSSNSIEKLDEFANIELKPGDEIYIPYKSNQVIVMGEVLNNIAISYRPKMSAKYYIEKVGGFTDQAKKRKSYIIKSNGSVVKISVLNKTNIEPGDTIIVPKKVGVPINWLEIAKNIATVAGNILSSVFILTKI